ncbi:MULTISPECIES: hypothetical protein [unclassified Actinopolyspora]|uniref:hypothetical protein n=1 Tax=unclassified Actinopolyspora TaxID=2639451 RepID=UPI0013F5D532|nr:MULTISPECIES: hypothetical protein [unclassified Actinopolyspora]NHD17797.1 hypothetical protein [Actinopolyspora sp. BKK2]NHE77670.1 hypothetical protein [Actinopolyspora sp. BKK1]
MVQVRRYTKKDGTEVRPHSRSSPGSGDVSSGPPGALVTVVLSLGILVLVGSGAGTNTSEEDEHSTWRHGGSTFTAVDSDDPESCVDHSYGRVKGFFAKHPCRKLRRTLLTVPARNGATTVVAVSRTTMPTVDSAVELRKLVDAQGTGNLEELTRDSLAYADVNFEGTYY